MFLCGGVRSTVFLSLSLCQRAYTRTYEKCAIVNMREQDVCQQKKKKKKRTNAYLTNTWDQAARSHTNCLDNNRAEQTDNNPRPRRPAQNTAMVHLRPSTNYQHTHAKTRLCVCIHTEVRASTAVCTCPLPADYLNRKCKVNFME